MSEPGTSRFLDLHALAALEHTRFTTRHRVEGSYSGRHRSRQQGGAGEFVDFREYSGGEDLRRLDWKVLARTGKAFIRLHQDETNLRCTLAVDASGSMCYPGSETAPAPDSKLQYVQYLATALSHVITRGQDQVGLALLDRELRDFLAPAATLAHVYRLQQVIERLDARPAQMMAEPLYRLFERATGRGVLLLLSDLLAEDLPAVFSALRLFRHRNWEVIVLHVIHPAEQRLPQGTACRFEGLEGEGYVDCSPAEIRTAYEQSFSEHLRTVRQLALAVGCDYRPVSTAVSYLTTLGGFLVERAS